MPVVYPAEHPEASKHESALRIVYNKGPVEGAPPRLPLYRLAAGAGMGGAFIRVYRWHIVPLHTLSVGCCPIFIHPQG